MSETSPRPDVAAIIQALRAEAERLDAVQLGDVGIVKQISDLAAEILGMEHVRPSVLPVVGALKDQAAGIT